MLLEFILQYRVGGEFIYRFVTPPFSSRLVLTPSRDKLRANILLKQHFLEVDLRHLSLYNDAIAHRIQDKPADILPTVRVISLSFDAPFDLQ